MKLNNTELVYLYKLVQYDIKQEIANNIDTVVWKTDLFGELHLECYKRQAKKRFKTNS